MNAVRAALLLAAASGTFLVAEVDGAREHYLVVRSYTTSDAGRYTLRVLPGVVEP